MLSEILRAYGVKGRGARRALLGIWKDALGAFPSAEALSDDEVAYFAELKCRMALTDTETDKAREELVHPRYRKAIAEVLEDGVVSPEERLRLQRLQSALRIPPHVHARLFGDAARPVMERRVREITADHRLSPEVGYSSSGVSFRIARGVYYRVGASRPQRVTTEGLEQVESGSLIITNKRVIFDGTRRNGTWRLASLLGFEAFSDGIALEKWSGKNPHLLISGDSELAAVILGAVLAAA